MSTVTFQIDHHGIGELLNSPEMVRAMEKVAYMIQITAEGIAAAEIYGARSLDVGFIPRREKEHPRGQHYAHSFHIKSHRYGGATHDRAEAIVYNDALSAIWVEWGHRGREPYHVMARAAFENGARRKKW
jgi:hypothetical protein